VSEVRQKFAIFHHILGQVIGHAIVLIYLKSQDAIPTWNLFGWFARQFGGGFGSVTIEMPGAVNIIFPLIMGISATGIYFLILSYRKKTHFSDPEITLKTNAAIITVYFGLFSGFALPYYVNRSFHAGQMSMTYIPLATALLAFCSLILSSIDKREVSNLKNSFPALIISFMVATVYLIPNPNIELNRINGGNPYGNFPPKTIEQAIINIPIVKKYAREQQKTVSYYGEGGNYVHMVTGISSSNIFNSPLDLFQSDAAVKLSCETLKTRGKDFLVLTPSAEQTFAWSDGSLCAGLYTKQDIPNVGTVGVRNK